MREIRFRAWAIESKTMAENVAYIGHKWLLDIVAFHRDSECGYDNFILMQFTWLKDRNWVDIYEWDMTTIFWINAEVRYSDTWCGWVFFDKSRPVELQELPFYDGTKWNYEDCEVIWNIYESPELLSN